MAGVDLEPNSNDDCIHNVLFQSCRSIGNGGAGFEIYTGRWIKPTGSRPQRSSQTRRHRHRAIRGEAPERRGEISASRDLASHGSTVNAWLPKLPLTVTFSSCLVDGLDQCDLVPNSPGCGGFIFDLLPPGLAGQLVGRSAGRWSLCLCLCLVRRGVGHSAMP